MDHSGIGPPGSLNEGLYFYNNNNVQEVRMDKFYDNIVYTGITNPPELAWNSDSRAASSQSTTFLSPRSGYWVSDNPDWGTRSQGTLPRAPCGRTSTLKLRRGKQLPSGTHFGSQDSVPYHVRTHRD